MPIQYEGIIKEHEWTRSKVSVFDICHMGEFIIEGTPEQTGLDRLITVNLNNMKDKTCKYGFILNEKGGIIDDIVVYKIKSDKWMLVVNATTTENDKKYISSNLRDKKLFTDISDDTCKLDVQGPLSLEFLKDIAEEDLSRLKYYTFDYFNFLGESGIISRTGYTGELGYELYISKKNIKNIWNKIISYDNIKPAGLGARDTLRLEMCYPLYGQDVDESISPLEAGFDKFIDFSKDFVGKNALLDKTKSQAKKLCCFVSKTRRAPRHNYKIYSDNKEIGYVTSGSFSPSLCSGIGMGYLDDDSAKKNAAITLKEGNIEIDANIKDRPLYRKGTARRGIR